jgi:integral membrane protein
MTTARTLRLVGWAEGGSLLLLLFVAMPLKYAFGLPLAVRLAGSLHGLLFLWFCSTLFGARVELGLRGRTVGLLLLAAVLPFGVLFIAREVRGQTGQRAAGEAE